MTDHYRDACAELTATGSPFAVTETVVRGVALKTFAAAPPSLRAIWESAAAENAAKLYVVYEDEHYTYGEIAASVRSLAHYLRDTHGVGSGDRVAIAMRNYPEWIVAYWATVSLGAAVVGMNAWWTGTEMPAPGWFSATTGRRVSTGRDSPAQGRLRLGRSLGG